MKRTTVGIDLVKNSFQICQVNRAGQLVSNRPVKRAKFVESIIQLPRSRIAMESCAGAHHWGRTLTRLGHDVVLVPPQHVKPFVRGGKSDPKDALAIIEAANRPALHAVPIKSPDQQDLQTLHRIRQLQVQHATAVANQIRGIAHEYGVCFDVGIHSLLRDLRFALEDGENELTDTARLVLAYRYVDLLMLREQVKRSRDRIVERAKELPAMPRLLEAPTYGDLVASSFLASIGDGRQFQRGRQVSAWLGLVPRQHGTGGKVRLYGMTKSGDRYLRTMLLHGARAAIRWSRDKDTPLARWIAPLIERRGFNKAVVALANKNARIAWHIVARGARYDPGKAFGSA